MNELVVVCITILYIACAAKLGIWLGGQPWIKRGNCTLCGKKLSPYTHPCFDDPTRQKRYCLKLSCRGEEYCGPGEKPNPNWLTL